MGAATMAVITAASSVSPEQCSGARTVAVTSVSNDTHDHLRGGLWPPQTDDKPRRFSAGFCFWMVGSGFEVSAQARAALGASARAIFLMFWAAAASRHWQ